MKLNLTGTPFRGFPSAVTFIRILSGTLNLVSKFLIYAHCSAYGLQEDRLWHYYR